MATVAGRRMSSLSGGHMSGSGGIVRETAVIGREIAMGRGMGRILGSLTLLTQYINSATSGVKQSKSAIREAADAYQQAASQAGAMAAAAMKKAEASAAAAKIQTESSGEYIRTLIDEKKANVAAAQAASDNAKATAAAAEVKAAAAKAQFNSSYSQAQSPGGLTIASMEKMQADRAEMKTAQAAAEADSQQAKAAFEAAAAYQVKAEAELKDAITAEQNATATMDTATADVQAAQAAQANAVALNAKAVSAAAAADQEEVLAAATATTSGTMLGALGIFGLLVLIIAEAYVVFRSLATMLGRTSEATKEAAKYANDHKLAVWEEIEAMEKLKIASENTTEAIRRMNEAKDQSVKLAEDAVNAAKDEANAKEKLYDAGIKSQLLDIKIAEKKGLITSKEATEQEEKIKLQEVSDKAAAKNAELGKESSIMGIAASNAEIASKQAQRDAQAASDKINKSPIGKKKAEMLAQDEKDLEAAKKEAEQATKDRIEYNKGGSNILWSSSLKARIEGYHGVADKSAALDETEKSKKSVVDAAEARIASLKENMLPDEKAAADAIRIAQQKTEAADSLKLDAQKAKNDYDINKKNSPAEVAAEQSNIKKEAELAEINNNRVQGYGLNSNQRIGSYAATPPIWKEQLEQLKRIGHNTDGLRGERNAPPGTRAPQLGTTPNNNHH